MGGRQSDTLVVSERSVLHPDDDYLWIVVIREENPDIGPCYSMVTTAASPLMSSIHDRMPALLRQEEMAEWLAGNGRWDLQPFSGALMVEPCESPLAKRQIGGSQQTELF